MTKNENKIQKLEISFQFSEFSSLKLQFEEINKFYEDQVKEKIYSMFLQQYLEKNFQQKQIYNISQIMQI